MATQFNYTKVVDLNRLTQEIGESANITIALDYLNLDGSNLDVYMKADLNAGEVTALGDLVTAHVNEPLETDEIINVAQRKQELDDDIPYVYSTARPIGWTTCFTGAGDNGDGVANRGAGERMLFNMLSTDATKTIDATFNEDVYLKDGLIIFADAPFGACMEIEVHHPTAGLVEIFGKAIPIFGTGRAYLNTEDRAFLPKGLIFRIIIKNSTGTGDEDAAADFKLSGRLELFREKLS
jgi:hypothetical protein